MILSVKSVTCFMPTSTASTMLHRRQSRAMHHTVSSYGYHSIGINQGLCLIRHNSRDIHHLAPTKGYASYRINQGLSHSCVQHRNHPTCEGANSVFLKFKYDILIRRMRQFLLTRNRQSVCLIVT